MTTDDTTTPPLTPPTTAGALMRAYRESHGLAVDTLAQVLRVPVQKLAALEADRLEDLPDAMFARALSLAVCRHLKTDPAPVLALLPGQDVSRLAPKNERGLDSPLHRPSFLPQSSFVGVVRFFSPARWAAVVLLVVALILGFWPDLHDLIVFKEDPSTPMPAAPLETPAAESPAVGNMVVTPVQSPALAQQAAPAPASAVTPGASDAR